MRKPSHPAADLFPMMTGAELVELTKDIAEQGLLEPIILHEGAVLDGRNRLVACERAGIEPRFVEWDGNGGSPTRFVLSHNLRRRHLTTSQRAAIAAEALPMFAEEARKRMLAGKAADPRTNSSEGAYVENNRARDEAGALVGVSGITVYRAKYVKQHDPEAFERVKAGEVTVNKAATECGLRLHPAPKVEGAPFVPASGRDVQRAEAHKRRMISAISTIAGVCHGIAEIDVAKARAACSDEEMQTWTRQARDLAVTIRRFSQSLNNGDGQ